VRDAAREALRKLGAETGGPALHPTPGAVETGIALSAPTIEGIPPPAARTLPSGTLALAERVDFALGSVSLTHDSMGGGTLLDLGLSGSYHRQMELTRFGYSFDAEVDASYGARSRTVGGTDTTSYLVAAGGGAVADGRLYLFDALPIHEFVTVAPGLGARYEKTRDAMSSSQDLTAIDLDVGGGIGYGRMLPVGARLRLHRIEAVLEAAGLKSRPIARDAAARVQLAWYGLRNRLGYSAELAYTLRILREAGVLLQEPDSATVYRLLQILSDPQLDDRQEGMDLRVGGYYAAEKVSGVDLTSFEGVLYSAAFAHQLGDRADLTLHLRGVFRASADPKGVLVSGDAAYRLFFYSAEQDPQGVLTLGGYGTACSDACPVGPSGEVAWQIGGRAGVTRFFSRTASVGLALDLATTAFTEWQLLLTLRAGYGLAPADVSIE
jgi:hypothetical protein